MILAPFPSQEIELPNDLQTLHFTINFTVDGGVSLISSVKQIEKKPKLFPYFKNKIAPWDIELNEKREENPAVIQYHSKAAYDN